MIASYKSFLLGLVAVRFAAAHPSPEFYETCTTGYSTSLCVEEVPSTRVETYTKTYTVQSVIQVPASETTTFWVPKTECSTSTSTCYETQVYTTYVPSVYTKTSSYETEIVDEWVTEYPQESCIETAYPSTVTSCYESLSYSECVERVPTTSTHVYTTTSCHCWDDGSC